jgi:hypothetical protein
MAFDLLSIPAMSSEYEHVFYQAKQQITDDRIRLGAVTEEAEQYQLNWLRSGLVN